jgi:hypothetical protein
MAGRKPPGGSLGHHQNVGAPEDKADFKTEHFLHSLPPRGDAAAEAITLWLTPEQ